MVLKILFRNFSSRLSRCMWVALFSALFSAAHAQIPDNDASVVSPKTAAKPDAGKTFPSILNEGTVDTTARLYLDDDGKPMLVPSESWGTFLKDKNERQALRNAQNQVPNFVFEETRIEVTVSGSQAQLIGNFKAALSSTAANFVAIPLRFDSCQLTEPPQFVGGGENLLEARSGASGYQWYLKADPNTKHTVTLKGGAVITQQADRRQLRLNLPMSPNTIVQLQLPASSIDEKVAGQENEVVERMAEANAVLIQIRGSGGETTVSWRDADASNRLSAVEATSTTRVQIDEPRQAWKASTEVTLRWFGDDASDYLELHLPPGARWLSVPTSLIERYLISSSAEQVEAQEIALAGSKADASSAAPPNREGNTAKDAQRLMVRNLDPSLMQPIELRLEWEWQPPVALDEWTGQPLQVPALMIDGVDRHTGTMEFLIPNGYAPVWREQAGTQLVQQVPPVDVFDRSQFLFRFSRQPLALTTSFRRPSNALPIKPIYLANIDSHKVKLTAWLDCTFDTAQPIAISMLPTDWKIESAAVVEMTQPHGAGESLSLQPQSDVSTLIAMIEPELAKINEQRSLRQIWRVIAYRPWQPEDSQAFSFHIPQLKQGNGNGEEAAFDHGTGILMVTGSDNLLLKNDIGKSKGLLVDSYLPLWPPQSTSTEATQPLVYRFQSRGEVPFWSGTAEPLPQQIVLAQQVELSVNASEVRIVQDFALQIANEPLTPMRLAVRRDALEHFEPQLTIDGIPIPLKAINELKPALESGITWQIFEPVSIAPLRGPVAVNIVSSVPWVVQNDLQLTPLSVPLVQLIVPRETRFREQTWSLKSARGIEVFELGEDRTETGAADIGNAQNRQSQLIAVAGKPHTLGVGQVEVALDVRKLANLAYLPVRIGRSWLQTTINGNERRDRYVVQLESDLPRLSIRIPASRNLSDVILDGKRAQDELSVVLTKDGTQFQIDLQNSADGLPHQLEVWMNSPQSLDWFTKLDIDIPEIEGAQFFDRFYWQLALPSIQHLGFGSARMTPDWIWKWKGLWWSRESPMQQAELEQWVGGTTQTEMPQSVNTYVLSAFGGGRSFQIWVLSRFALWLPIGCGAIAVSVLLVSVRQLRHPAWLLLSAAGIATAAMLAPDLAVLLGQTALASLGLVSLILITQAAIDIRVRRRSVFTVRPSHFSERSDHVSLVRQVKIAAPSSTRAHSAVIADGEK